MRFIFTSVDTEMCCPKGKCGCQYFILLTLKKKNHGHRGPGFFNKKLILDYYFCLKSVMFRQFKEKNKNVLRLKLKSALKI
jgi:hypothetical protein